MARIDLGLIKEVDGIAATFAPDGATLAVTSKAGVTLYRVADGVPLATIADDINPFDPERTSVAYSPDAQTIALLGTGLGLQLWRATNGTPLQTLPGGWNEGALAFTPDGRTLISANQSEPVRLWRARPSGD